MKLTYEIMGVRIDGTHYWRRGHGRLALLARATNEAGQEVCTLAGWWSNKHGWLEPRKKNVQHYSRLTTLPTILQAARRAKAWLLKHKPSAVVSCDEEALEAIAAKF